jgi:glycosyltransferase involved in cell wall biosynthesis
MRTLFLYAEITGYLVACLRTLRKHPAVESVTVYQGQSLAETGFSFQSEDGIDIKNAIGRTSDELWSEISRIAPDLVYVSGWSFRPYLALARRLRRNGATVVCGNDTPWHGTARQWIGSAASPLLLHPYFDAMWVPGTFQFEFARRLGFQRRQIYSGLLSADVDAFKDAKKERPEGLPRTLLSVGRMVADKGMEELVDAFTTLRNSGETDDWRLLLVGDGPLREKLARTPGVETSPFLPPKEMPALFASASAFALASSFEPWGVVVHEAAAAGLPLLVSDSAGSTAAFVRDRYNGLLFSPRRPGDLREKLHKLLSEPEGRLAVMGKRSSILAQQITPEMWAQTFVNIRLDAAARQ